ALSAVPPLAAGNSGGTTAVTLGATPIDLTTSVDRPALVSLVAPGVRGDRLNTGIRVDAAPFSSPTTCWGADPTLSPAVFGLVPLTPGSHTSDPQWVRWPDGTNSVTRDSTLAGSLDAIFFQTGTVHAESRIVATAAAESVPLTSSYVSWTPQGAANPFGVSMNLPRPSKVLVLLDASSFRPYPNWPQSVDVALFVNGVVGKRSRVTIPNSIDWGVHGFSMVDVVDLPAGPASIDVRFKLIDPSGTGSNPVVQIEPAAATGWRTIGIGA